MDTQGVELIRPISVSWASCHTDHRPHAGQGAERMVCVRNQCCRLDTCVCEGASPERRVCLVCVVHHQLAPNWSLPCPALSRPDIQVQPWWNHACYVYICELVCTHTHPAHLTQSPTSSDPHPSATPPPHINRHPLPRHPQPLNPTQSFCQLFAARESSADSSEFDWL